MSWARSLGEFGATIMFAGNVEGGPRHCPWSSTASSRAANVDASIAPPPPSLSSPRSASLARPGAPTGDGRWTSGRRVASLPATYIGRDDGDGTTVGQRLVRARPGDRPDPLDWRRHDAHSTTIHRLLLLGAPFAAALLIPATALARDLHGNPGPILIVRTAAKCRRHLGPRGQRRPRGPRRLDVIYGGADNDCDRRQRRQHASVPVWRRRQRPNLGRLGAPTRSRQQGRCRLGRSGQGRHLRRQRQRHPVRRRPGRRDRQEAWPHDFVYGGSGNDIIRVGGDRMSDAVHCGPGWDIAYLGRYDIARQLV